MPNTKKGGKLTAKDILSGAEKVAPYAAAAAPLLLAAGTKGSGAGDYIPFPPASHVLVGEDGTGKVKGSKAISSKKIKLGAGKGGILYPPGIPTSGGNLLPPGGDLLPPGAGFRDAKSTKKIRDPSKSKLRIPVPKLTATQRKKLAKDYKEGFKKTAGGAIGEAPQLNEQIPLTEQVPMGQKKMIRLKPPVFSHFQQFYISDDMVYVPESHFGEMDYLNDAAEFVNELNDPYTFESTLIAQQPSKPQINRLTAGERSQLPFKRR